LTIEGESCQAPDVVDDLAISAAGGSVALAWSAAAGAEQYQVWRSVNDPYSAPGLDAPCTDLGGCTLVTGTGYDDAVLGDPAANHAYQVRPVAACGGVAGASNRVAEFEYRLEPGAALPDAVPVAR
jgi:hypothetical protein